MVFNRRKTRNNVVTKCIALVIAFCLAVGGVPAGNVLVKNVNAAPVASIYVSTNGNDANPGTVSQPLKTIEAARNMVATMNSNMTGDIYVYIASGTYYQSQTLNFTQTDSATNGYHIVYQSYNGPVNISGGKKLTGWTPFATVSGNTIYSATFSSPVDTRELYVNGAAAIRARTQIASTATTTALAGYTFTKPTSQSDTTVGITGPLALASWVNQNNIEMVFKGSNWTRPRVGVSSITTGTNAKINMQQPMWFFATNKGATSVAAAPIWVENAYELLDNPGEWYLDKTGAVGSTYGTTSHPGANTFYYLPKAGEDVSTANVVVPTVEKLVNIQSSNPDTPVTGITFQGIDFSDATWLDPNQAGGHSDGQNNYIRNLPNAAWSDRATGGNIVLTLTNDVNFMSCQFYNFGNVALYLYQGNSYNKIIGNHFYNLASEAIQIGDVDYTDPHNFMLPQFNSNIEGNSTGNVGVSGYYDQTSWDYRYLQHDIKVQNNTIHDIGLQYFGASAVGAVIIQNSDFSHNELYNLPYSGFHIGYGTTSFPGKASPFGNNTIQYNYIHEVMQVTMDGGAIYANGPQAATSGTSGWDAQTIISDNYIRNQAQEYASLYLDDAANYYHVYNNVTVNVHSSYMAKHVRNKIHNNYSTQAAGSNTASIYESGVATVTNNFDGLLESQFPPEAIAIEQMAGVQSQYVTSGTTSPVISNQPPAVTTSSVTVTQDPSDTNITPAYPVGIISSLTGVTNSDSVKLYINGASLANKTITAIIGGQTLTATADASGNAVFPAVTVGSIQTTAGASVYTNFINVMSTATTANSFTVGWQNVSGTTIVSAPWTYYALHTVFKLDLSKYQLGAITQYSNNPDGSLVTLTSANGSISVVNDGTGRAIQIYKAASSPGNVGLNFPVDAAGSNIIEVSADIKQPNTSTTNYLLVAQNYTTGTALNQFVHLDEQAGNVAYYSSNVGTNALTKLSQKYLANTWHNLKAVIHTQTGTFDYYYNGKLLQSGITNRMSNIGDVITTLQTIVTNNANTGAQSYLIRNMTLRTDAAAPSSVNRTALLNRLDYANNTLKSADYTNWSTVSGQFTAIVNDMSNSSTTAGRNPGTQSIIDTDLANLNSSIAALTASGTAPTQTTLKPAITTALTKNPDAYTVDSFHTFQAALDNAMLVDYNPSSSAQDYRDAQNTLTSAQTALVAATAPTGSADMTAFTNAVNSYTSKYISSDFTSVSFTPYQKALDTATADVSNGSLTQVAADLDIQNLKATERNLVANVNTQAYIRGLIALSSNYIQNNYTGQSWAVFQNAVNELTAVNASFDQTNADHAVANYAKARTQLVGIDKTALNTAITLFESLTASNYTPATWATYASAVQSARAVQSDPYVLQSGITAATTAVTNAKTALVNQTVSKTALAAAISSGTTTNTGYTPYSWGEYQTALALANAVNGDPNVNQTTVDFKTSELNRTFAALTLIPAVRQWTVQYVLQNSNANILTKVADDSPIGATLPANPTAPNATFKGWYDKAVGGNPVDATKVITSDTAIFAQWTNVTVNFYQYKSNAPAEGTSMPVNITGTYATAMGSYTADSGTIIPSNATTNPTKTGVTFLGWSPWITKAGVPSGSLQMNAGSIMLPIYTNMFAVWGLAVNFNANGGTNTGANTIYVSPNFSTTGTIQGTTLSVFNIPTDPVRTGYKFNGWYTATSGGTKVNTTTPITTNGTNYYAQWTPVYTITSSAGINGSISPSGSFKVTEGAPQTFTITPNNGYKIDTFTVDGTDTTVTNNTYTFTNVTSDHTINVTFKPIVHTITATAGSNGSIDPSGSVAVNEGTSKAFTITPDSSYMIDTFTVDGAVTTVTSNTYTFTNVTSDHTIHVTFKPVPPNVYTITAISGDGGTISGNINVTHGTDATFTFTPDSGYLINTLTVDGVSETVTGDTYTFTNVTSNHTIHVTFSPEPPAVHTITANAVGNGTINPTGNVAVIDGANQIFTIAPNNGYMIDTFTVDGMNTTVTNNTYMFTNVTSNHTILVAFKQIPIVQVPPVDQKHDEPIKEEDPKKVTISQDELKKSPKADKVVIEVSKDVKEIVLPSNAAELLGQNQLSISSDQLTMNVPADLFKQLADMAANQKDSKIVLKVEPLNDVEVKDLLAKGKISKNEQVKTGGQVFDLKLLLVSQDGAETSLTKFNKPITIRLKVSPTAKPNLSGIYYIGDNGELEFIGGKYENGEFVAEIHHFSKYAVLEFTKSFTDVASTHWAYGAIQEMASKHVVNGTSETTFQPDREITRAEFTTMLVNTLNLKETSALTFADVSSQAWYADAVSKAVKAGIVTGKEVDTFDPNSSISREEMVTMMMRAYAMLHDDKVIVSGALTFKDAGKVASWSLASVQAAASLQLINGRTADEFDPQGISTRAEAVTVLKRLLQ